ncbi:MAG: hypothetical protein RJB10_2075, partial [Pseudomonadota bacterium]
DFKDAFLADAGALLPSFFHDERKDDAADLASVIKPIVTKLISKHFLF